MTQGSSRYTCGDCCSEFVRKLGDHCPECWGDWIGRRTPNDPEYFTDVNGLKWRNSGDGWTYWSEKDWTVSPSPPPGYGWHVPIARGGKSEPLAGSGGMWGGAWLAILGGLALIIGPLLPWATVGTLSRNGFQLGKHLSFSPDGLVCLLLGVLIVTIGVPRLRSAPIPNFIRRSPIGSALVDLTSG